MTTRKHVFCEFLRENVNIRETVSACSIRAQVEFFFNKEGVDKPRENLFLN